jgi:hypothetical protein
MHNWVVRPFGFAFALVLVGCVVHEARPAFRSAVVIGDRGITVPLPPPSFIDAPRQAVAIEGSLTGDAITTDFVVHIADIMGETELAVELPTNATNFAASAEIDLSANCLEFAVENHEGARSEPSLYHVEIVDATSLRVVEGC